MTDYAIRLIPLDLANTWHAARGRWSISKDMSRFTYLGYPREDDPIQDGLCLSDHRITDGIFEAEVMVNEVVPSGTNAHLVFRYHDTELYSFAGLGGWDYKFVIAHRTPSESALRQPGWAPVAQDARIQDIAPRQWYRLKVDFSGHNIDLYLGEVCVLRYTSTQRSPYYPVGNIGFRGYGKSRVHFKNPRLFQRVRASDLSTRLQNVDFAFFKSPTLQALALKDLEQVRTLDPDEAPKAVVILLGSVAEAALLDAIDSHEPQARKATSAKKGATRWWGLEVLIEVARELHAISETTYATSHTLRNYRNLIHPGNPEAQELGPRPSQAVAATDFVLTLFKDLREFAVKP